MFRLLIAAIISSFATSSLGQDAQRSITEVGGGLYRVSSDNHHGMYWVTDAGIVVLDPINAGSAAWLKEQLAERHGLPVRYVIYSHDHYDHSYGGEVFDDPGTVFVAHELAREALVRTKAATRIPELTFDDGLALHLGDETLRLRHHGPNNGRGSVSFHFEDAGVLFVVDWIVVGRVPYRDFRGYDVEGVIRSTRDVLSLEWDTFVGGHGEVGDRAGVERYLAYLEALYAAVRDGMLAGRSLEAIQESVRLDAFADLANFDAWRALNIAGVYRQLAEGAYLLDRPDVPEPGTGD